VAGLNAAAMQAALGFEVHACTDVTGFGIVGHAVEMARASGLGFHLDFRRLPFHPQALPMYRKGQTTGSNEANRKAVDGFWERRVRLSADEEELLFDPQTSGGLLLAVPGAQADGLAAALRAAGVAAAAQVGEVADASRPGVTVR
jgi:selenide,water dikinase